MIDTCSSVVAPAKDLVSTNYRQAKTNYSKVLLQTRYGQIVAAAQEALIQQIAFVFRVNSGARGN